MAEKGVEEQVLAMERLPLFFLLPTLQLTLTSSKNLLNSALICRNL